eukprot:m.126459 g.126459  ORF g.126459 m.126459 type:complete len:792 (-) comp29201_c0_seq1:136-2511(-)
MVSLGATLKSMLVLDTVSIVALFFIIGVVYDGGEEAWLDHEVKDSPTHWEEDIIDLTGLAALRAALLAILLYLIEAPPSSGVSDLKSLGRPTERSLEAKKPEMIWVVLAYVVLIVNLAYCSARGILLLTNKEHPDGLASGEAVVILSVTFTILELIFVFLYIKQRTKNFSKGYGGLSINGDGVKVDVDSEGKTKKKSKGASLTRLFQLAKPEYGLLFAGFMMLLVSSVSTVLAPMFFGKVIDASNKHDKKGLTHLIMILGILYIGGAVASFFRSVLFTMAGQRLVARVRSDLFATIIKQEIAFFDVTRTGELTNRLASDTAVIQNACTVNLSMLARYTVQIVGSLALMFSLSWNLTLVLISVIPGVGIGAVAYGRQVKKIRKKFQDALADASTTAEENISNIRTVRCFSNEDRAAQEYDDSITNSYREGKKLAIVQGGFIGVMGTLGSGAILLVLWYGATLVCRDKLSTGTLTAFMLYAVQVAAAFGFLSSLYGDFMQALGASVRMFDIFDRKPLINLKGGRTIERNGNTPIDSTVQLNNMSFRYPSREDTAVLENISLTVPSGKIIALVGPSGGGKSTIVSLIERMYDPNEGNITLGGIDIKLLDPSWLRSRISIVNQEPTLFACSIKDNIRYGRGTATDEEVQKAAEQANAHQFITGFENGYETMVGERGVRLSGGQKQRVAVARALLCNPDILLLDEATSALDAESEHLVQEAIERAMIGRTVVVIAHRLSTVLNANLVVVIEKGKVKEQGTHQELLQLGGLYKKLVARQLLQSDDTNEAVSMLEKQE